MNILGDVKGERPESEKKTIFIVDDSHTNLVMAEEAIENHFRVVTLSSAEKMFTILEKLLPDMILLDIKMPGMNGFDAMKRLKAVGKYAEIPVIFLTVLSDPDSEAHGIELGAADFISKPFSAPVLLNRIRYHLHIDEIIHERTEQLHMRTIQLARLQNGTIHTLADIVENRDRNTGGHIDRTTVYMRLLIDSMKAHGVYLDEIEDWDADLVANSARLHDLGKIAVSDTILNKPGTLTCDEFSIMKEHTLAGERIIDRIADRAGEGEFLNSARSALAYHHEHWDGSGYPYGLKGTDIPLHGRIMALIDVYDALTSERSYKEAFPHEKAVDIIVESAGKHFDPLIVEAFYEERDRFEEVRGLPKRASPNYV